LKQKVEELERTTRLSVSKLNDVKAESMRKVKEVDRMFREQKRLAAESKALLERKLKDAETVLKEKIAELEQLRKRDAQGDPVDRLMIARRKDIDNTIRSYDEIVRSSGVEMKKVQEDKSIMEGTLKQVRQMSASKATLGRTSREKIDTLTADIKRIKAELDALATKFIKAAEDMSKDEANAKLAAVAKDPSKAGKSSVLVKYAGSCMELADAEKEIDTLTARAGSADEAKRKADAQAEDLERQIANAAKDLLALDAKVVSAKDGIRRETEGIAKLKRSMQVARAAVEWMRVMTENTFTPTVANLPETIAKYKQYKIAGYTAKQCKDAGYTAKECKDSGYTAKECKDAGYTVEECTDAGFTLKELYDARHTDLEFRIKGLANHHKSTEVVKACNGTYRLNADGVFEHVGSDVTGYLYKNKYGRWMITNDKSNIEKETGYVLSLTTEDIPHTAKKWQIYDTKNWVVCESAESF